MPPSTHLYLSPIFMISMQLILIFLLPISEASPQSKLLTALSLSENEPSITTISKTSGLFDDHTFKLPPEEDCLMERAASLDPTGTKFVFVTQNSTGWAKVYTAPVNSPSSFTFQFAAADILSIHLTGEPELVAIARLNRDSPLQLVSMRIDDRIRILHTFEDDLEVCQGLSAFDSAAQVLYTPVRDELFAFNITSGQVLPRLKLDRIPVTIDVNSVTGSVFMVFSDGESESQSLVEWNSTLPFRIAGTEVSEGVSALDSSNSTLVVITRTFQGSQNLVSTSISSDSTRSIPFEDPIVNLDYTDRAEVNGATPLVGPSSGGTRVTMFGRYFRDTALTMCLFGEVKVKPSIIYNATTVLCIAPILPPGIDMISISNDGDANSLSSVHFTSYIAPSITQITPTAGLVHGNYTVTVTGTGFMATDQLECRFGNTSVPATYVSPTTVTCIVPLSIMSISVPVEATLNGQHYTGNNVLFHYHCGDGYYCNGDGSPCLPCPPAKQCPFVHNATVIQCKPGTFSKGHQMHCTPCKPGLACPDPFGLTMNRCWQGSYSSKGQSACTSCPRGFACPHTNETSEIPCTAGQYSRGNTTACTRCLPGRQCPDTGGRRITACPAGSFSVGGQAQCTSCPRGSMCVASSVAPTTCPKGSFNNVTGLDHCDPCARPDRCTGGSGCLPAYTGSECLDCSRGYFRFGGDCLECSAVPVPAFVMFGLALLVAFLIYKTGLDFRRVTQLKIFFNQLQIMLVAVSLSISFPLTFLQFLDFLAVINLNIDMASPECYFDDWTWYHELYIGVALSIFLLVVTESIRFVALTLRQRNAARPNRTLDLEQDSKLSNVANGARRLLVLFTTVVYVPLTRSFLRVFDCRDDGVLRVDPKLVCSGTSYAVAVVIAIVGLLIVTVGLPLFVLLFMGHLLRRNSQEKHSPDVLGGEFHLLDDGQIRGRYGVLYESFKKQFAYFEGTIMIRKALLIVLTTFLSSIPVVQALLVVLVNLIFLFVSFKWRPYAPLFRTIGPIRLDVLNSMDISGNLLGVVNGIVATLLAFKLAIPSVASTAVLIMTFCLAILILTGLGVTTQRKASLFKSRNDDPRDAFNQIKSQIQQFLESGQYEEADEHLFMLNKLRGRRIAELKRMRDIRVERMQDIREIDKELTFYQPPISTDDVVLSDFESPSPLKQFQSFEFTKGTEIEAEIDNHVMNGTLMTSDGLEKCTELRVMSLEWIDIHESALKDACDVERYILAKDIAQNLNRLKSIVQGIASPTTRRRTLTTTMRQSIPLAVLHRSSDSSQIALLGSEECRSQLLEAVDGLKQEVQLMKTQLDSAVHDREYNRASALHRSKIAPSIAQARRDVGHFLKRLALLGEDHDTLRPIWSELEDILTVFQPTDDDRPALKISSDSLEIATLQSELSQSKERVKQATDDKEYDKSESIRAQFLEYVSDFVSDCEGLEGWNARRHEYEEAEKMREIVKKAEEMRQLYE